MADAAPVEADVLAHEPERKPGFAGGSVGAPPWRAVVHQHGLGQAAASKGLDELLLDGGGVSGAVGGERNQVAAVVVEHGERPDGLGPAAGSLEVHLPEFVGMAALEAAGGLRVLILFPHQIVA